MSEPVCKYCGAEFSHRVNHYVTVWECGTKHRHFRSQDDTQSSACRTVELEAENKRLRASELFHRQCHDELRAEVLADPDHDGDTINWALGVLDDHLTYTQAPAEPAESASGDMPVSGGGGG